MKKVVSISFLIVFLLSNTELPEVLKVPFLLDHYKLHQKKEIPQSFLAFIYDHYVSLQKHTHSQNEHDNLPLKTKDCIKCSSTIVFCHVIQCALQNEDFYNLKQIILFKETLHSNLNKSSIWEPPQLG